MWNDLFGLIWVFLFNLQKESFSLSIIYKELWLKIISNYLVQRIIFFIEKRLSNFAKKIEEDYFKYLKKLGSSMAGPSYVFQPNLNPSSSSTRLAPLDWQKIQETQMEMNQQSSQQQTDPLASSAVFITGREHKYIYICTCNFECKPISVTMLMTSW